MKKIFLILIAICCLQAAKAQQYTPQQLDQAIARRAVAFALKPDKEIVETGEQIQVNVELQIFPGDPATMNPGDANYGQDYRYDTSNPASEPYKIKNWKIMEQGAGTLNVNDDFATYKAPATIPAGRCATISVELVPNRPGLAKIILLQTIYIEDNPIVFYFDAPKAGIMQEKYIIKPNDNQMNQLAGMQLPPSASAAQQAKMAALQAQLAQVTQQARAATAAKGMNMDVAMSNAKAIYARESNITTMQFMGHFTVTKNARYAGVKEIMITLTFKGMAPGQYAIKRAKENTAYMIYMSNHEAFGCANDPKKNPDEKGIHCAGGNIDILSFTDGTFKGTVHAKLEGYGTTGTLDGKFSVKLANM
jgi:hypothetical protein